ncbi:DUF2867 domain-containing protein [Serinicoccus kebangsaanensis]|uniref:DUF2867 domain-containing protein n=1 Tax=Serinicoccus kebangsaanensis TaxID=2602069 RepID=UPI00124E86E8|nr:DUF2867 domain-containing protein [Serinicoccus kebangsaanensis]
MRNLHRRVVTAPAATVAPLLARLGGADDPLWPAPAWVPMRLDPGLVVGAHGGHGEVRYRVEELEPGARVRFRFAPEVGLDGWHELRIDPAGPAASRLTHEIRARPRGAMRALWPLAVRWMHDAVLEDLLDNAELIATGTVRRPARWTPYVRVLRTAFERSVREVRIPEAAVLLRRAEEGQDWSLRDAWQVPLPRHVSRDPREWHRAIFGTVPPWVAAALVARQLLVPLVGIEQGDRSSFDLAAASGTEALVSTGASHLDFHASVLVEERSVTLSTLARPHTTVGRLYLTVVRVAHPLVIRSMLRRALADLSERAPGAGERELERRHTSV